jgi:hypothetical protein
VSRRRAWGRAGWAALSLVLLVGCDNDDDTSGATKNAPLFEFNAAENGGRTVRWPNLPIRVFLGNGVARANEITVWTGATSGAVTFTFVGSAGAANITYDTGVGNPDICGITDILMDGDHIVAAAVSVNASLYRSRGCVRTVTHEAAHGIGFLGHTSDGGLMDDDGGNGVITPLVAGVLRDLYLLPPGTLVVAQTKQFGLRLPTGKRAKRFTYPVRL